MDAAIYALAKAQIFLEKVNQYLTITWVTASGKDINTPKAREWLATIRDKIVNESCTGWPICQDVAKSKRDGRLTCVECEGYSAGISPDIQKALNKLIIKCYGREEISKKRQYFVYTNMEDTRPKILSYGERIKDIVPVVISSNNPGKNPDDSGTILGKDSAEQDTTGQSSVVEEVIDEGILNVIELDESDIQALNDAHADSQEEFEPIPESEATEETGQLLEEEKVEDRENQEPDAQEPSEPIHIKARQLLTAIFSGLNLVSITDLSVIGQRKVTPEAYQKWEEENYIFDKCLNWDNFCTPLSFMANMEDASCFKCKVWLFQDNPDILDMITMIIKRTYPTKEDIEKAFQDEMNGNFFLKNFGAEGALIKSFPDTEEKPEDPEMWNPLHPFEGKAQLEKKILQIYQGIVIKGKSAKTETKRMQDKEGGEESVNKPAGRAKNEFFIHVDEAEPESIGRTKIKLAREQARGVQSENPNKEVKLFKKTKTGDVEVSFSETRGKKDVTGSGGRGRSLATYKVTMSNKTFLLNKGKEMTAQDAKIELKKFATEKGLPAKLIAVRSGHKDRVLSEYTPSIVRKNVAGSHSRNPRCELVFPNSAIKPESLGKIHPSDARLIAQERANRLRAQIELWKIVVSRKNARELVDVFDPGKDAKTDKKVALLSTPASENSVISERMKSLFKEIALDLEEIKNLPAEMTEDDGDGFHTCIEEVGGIIQPLGILTSKQIEERKKQNASMPIAPVIKSKRVSMKELVNISNKLLADFLARRQFAAWMRDK